MYSEETTYEELFAAVDAMFQSDVYSTVQLDDEVELEELFKQADQIDTDY